MGEPGSDHALVAALGLGMLCVLGTLSSAFTSIVFLLLLSVGSGWTALVAEGCLAAGWVVMLRRARGLYGWRGAVFMGFVAAGQVAGAAFILFVARLAAGINGIG